MKTIESQAKIHESFFISHETIFRNKNVSKTILRATTGRIVFPDSLATSLFLTLKRKRLHWILNQLCERVKKC